MGFSDHECEHALRCEWLSKGRVCALDGLICHNYDKPEAVAKCPAIKALRRAVGAPPKPPPYT
ncbi:MAG: hypothetical protein QXU45_08960 [Candidatus Bathyarchaeia archaeon]